MSVCSAPLAVARSTRQVTSLMKLRETSPSGDLKDPGTSSESRIMRQQMGLNEGEGEQGGGVEEQGGGMEEPGGVVKGEEEQTGLCLAPYV